MRKALLLLVAALLVSGAVGVAQAQDNNPNTVPPILPDLGGRVIAQSPQTITCPFPSKTRLQARSWALSTICSTKFAAA